MDFTASDGKRPQETEPQDNAPVQGTQESVNPGSQTIESASQEAQQQSDNWPQDIPRDKDGQRPSDTAWVDFQKLRAQVPQEIADQVENRIHALRKQVGAQDRYLDQLAKDFGDVSRVLDELKKPDPAAQQAATDMRRELHEIKLGQQVREEEQRINVLKQELARANMNLDHTRASDLLTEIVQRQTKLEKTRGTSFEDQPSIVTRAEQPAPLPQAPQKNTMTPREQLYFEEWSHEANQNGQLLRPWLQADHPWNGFMVGQMQSYLQNPNIRSRGFVLSEILDAADAIWESQISPQPAPITAPLPAQPAALQQQPAEAPKPRPQPTEVLVASRDVRTQPQADELVLSSAQKQTAHRLYGQEGKSPKEAEKLYLAALKRTRAADKAAGIEYR